MSIVKEAQVSTHVIIGSEIQQPMQPDEVGLQRLTPPQEFESLSPLPKFTETTSIGPAVDGRIHQEQNVSNGSGIIFVSTTTKKPSFAEEVLTPVEKPQIIGEKVVSIGSKDQPTVVNNQPDILMAKKNRRGTKDNGAKQRWDNEKDELRKQHGIPAGKRIEKRHINGKGLVPCVWEGGKWKPIF